MGLKEELARLADNSAPVRRMVDPEDTHVSGMDAPLSHCSPSDIATGRSDNTKDSDDDFGYSVRASKVAPEGTLLRGIEVGDKYQGVKVDRRHVAKNYSKDGEDSSYAMDDVYNAAVKCSRKAIRLSDVHGDSADDASEDSDVESISDSQRNGDRICKEDVNVLLGALAARQDKEREQSARAFAGKLQLKLWGELMGLRIRMQPLMQAAASLPQPDAYEAYMDCKETTQMAIKDTQNSLLETLRLMLSLRQTLVTRSTLIKPSETAFSASVQSATKKLCGGKRKRVSLSACDDIWKYVPNWTKCCHNEMRRKRDQEI